MVNYKKLSNLKSIVNLVLIVGLLLIMGIGFGSYNLLVNVSSKYSMMQQNQVKLASIERMVYLDEVLSQSAKYYVYFNNEIYKDRYDSIHQEFDELQSMMVELEWSEQAAPYFEILDDSTSTEELDESSVEKKAFDLLNTGAKDSALSLLTNDDYAFYKQKFLSTLEEIRKSEKLDNEAAQNELALSLGQLRSAFISGMIIVFIIFLILAVLSLVISNVFRNNRTLYNTLQKSVAKEHESDKFQATLLSDLKEYAELTSHKLRAPLARMQGVMGLISLEKEDGVHLKTLIGLLEDSSSEMDEITKEMNHILTRNSYYELSPSPA